MSFTTGEGHFICPSCGAPVKFPVIVSAIEVIESRYVEQRRVIVRYPESVSVPHSCQKVLDAQG